MIKLFKQLGQKVARLLIVAILFSTVVIVCVSTPVSATSNDGWWGEIKSGNSLPTYQMCLTTQGVAGRPVYQSGCQDKSWQRWHMQAVGGSDYYFNIESEFNGYCLDVEAASHANDAVVTTSRCNGSTNQQWHPSWTSQSSFLLKPRHSENDGPFYPVSYTAKQVIAPHSSNGSVSRPRGKCLDVFDYSHNAGYPRPELDYRVLNGRVIQWTCLDGVNQQWSYDGSWQGSLGWPQ